VKSAAHFKSSAGRIRSRAFVGGSLQPACKCAVTKSHEVTAAVESGEAIAKHVVESAGKALGNSVAFLINVLDPEAIIVAVD